MASGSRTAETSTDYFTNFAIVVAAADTTVAEMRTDKDLEPPSVPLTGESALALLRALNRADLERRFPEWCRGREQAPEDPRQH